MINTAQNQAARLAISEAARTAPPTARMGGLAILEIQRAARRSRVIGRRGSGLSSVVSVRDVSMVISN